ncbi:MAG: type IV pilin-like G/H family protein [Pseudanabaenaceae cyanobacterium]
MLLSCSARDEETERAREAVTLICRSQVAFYVEKGRLTDRLSELRIEWLNLSQTTPHYTYSIQLLPLGSPQTAVTLAVDKRDRLHFMGIVRKQQEGHQFQTIICQGKTLPSRVEEFSAHSTAPRPDCPAGLQLAASVIN